MTDAYNPFEPPAADEPKPGARTSSSVQRLASLRARLAAFTVDIVIGTGSAFLLVNVFGLSLSIEYAGDISTRYASVLSNVAVYVAIHGYFLTRYSQTIGKRALGIQIVNVSDGRRSSFARIPLLRILPVQIVAFLPVFSVIRYLVIIDVLAIFRKDRRCFHDLLAGTRVVVVDRATTSQRRRAGADRSLR